MANRLLSGEAVDDVVLVWPVEDVEPEPVAGGLAAAPRAEAIVPASEVADAPDALLAACMPPSMICPTEPASVVEDVREGLGPEPVELEAEAEAAEVPRLGVLPAPGAAAELPVGAVGVAVGVLLEVEVPGEDSVAGDPVVLTPEVG
jgi:hypothetical protein